MTRRLSSRLAGIAAACVRIVAILLVAPFWLAGATVGLCVSAFMTGWREIRS